MTPEEKAELLCRRHHLFNSEKPTALYKDAVAIFTRMEELELAIKRIMLEYKDPKLTSQIAQDALQKK